MNEHLQVKGKKLSDDLLALYDDFSEFNACCAFFCEVATFMGSTEDYCADEASAEGLRIFAQQLKERSAALKGEVEAIWKAASSQDRH